MTRSPGFVADAAAEFSLCHTRHAQAEDSMYDKECLLNHIVTDVLMISIFSFYTVEFRYNAINFLQIAQFKALQRPPPPPPTPTP